MGAGTGGRRVPRMKEASGRMEQDVATEHVMDEVQTGGIEVPKWEGVVKGVQVSRLGGGPDVWRA